MSEAAQRWAANAECAICKKRDYVRPLHGDAGGPLCCLLCIGEWHAEHGRRRRTGRIVIRALNAYEEAGGDIWRDLDKLKLSGGNSFGLDLDPLGYMADTARPTNETIELTSELLGDTLRLTHPDRHPPERRELAERVTKGLLQLQPFVFPAPKPKPAEPKPAESASSYPDNRDGHLTGKSDTPRYPCAGCADTVPKYYCTPCRTEYEKRQQKEFDRRTTKQRAGYKRRRERVLARRPLRRCETCGEEVKRRRADARYCSNACRQHAHRQAVTDKPTATMGDVSSRNNGVWEPSIVALLKRHPAVFLNDLLPEERTRAQYQALSLAAVKLETEDKITSISFWTRWGKPGHKVLLRRGYQTGENQLDPKQIHRLTAEEQRAFASEVTPR